MENLQVQSNKIQNLLLSIPALSSNLSNFFGFSKEEKNSMLTPISTQLKELNLTIDDVISVLDTYSKNINVEYIDKECEKIIGWLLSEGHQAEDGSWPLAGDPSSEIRKNAWANAICCLALLKYRRYKKLYKEPFDKKISDSIKWLFDTNNKIYITDKGWKQYPDDPEINFYDTSIALNAILKYRSECGEDNFFTYKVSDNKVENIVKFLLDIVEGFDIGIDSYIVMTLEHFYSDFQNINDDTKVKIKEKIFKNIDRIVQSYEENIGWRNNSNNPSLEISCYANQALLKSKYFLEDVLKDKSQIDNYWGKIVKIIASEIVRIENCFTYINDFWGWPDECGGVNIKLHNTSLATSTLLKCSYRSNLMIDLSIILRSVNSLIKSFRLAKITLDNTYILCAIIDYLIYRSQ